MRECNTCHIAKPLSEYHNAPHLRDFKTYKCKACMREWGIGYREKNRAELKARADAYKLANYEHVRAIQRTNEKLYYVRNSKERNKAFGERVKIRRRTDPAFRQKKRDLARTHYLKRYGSEVALAALFDSQLGQCANPFCNKSLKDGCHVDHIMPVALGGLNDLRNFQFLCPNCNHRKTKRHPDEWEASERKRAAF